MVATTHRIEPPGGQRARGLRGCASALALVMLFLPCSAKADTLSAGVRAYESHDFVRAAPLLLVEAERGLPIAQTYIGYMYQNGLGVPRDYVEAEVWLNLAASQASAKQRDYWARVRDAVAQKLTLDQLAEAQRRAVAWAPIASR